MCIQSKTFTFPFVFFFTFFAQRTPPTLLILVLSSWPPSRSPDVSSSCFKLEHCSSGVSFYSIPWSRSNCRTLLFISCAHPHSTAHTHTYTIVGNNHYTWELCAERFFVNLQKKNWNNFVFLLVCRNQKPGTRFRRDIVQRFCPVRSFKGFWPLNSRRYGRENKKLSASLCVDKAEVEFNYDGRLRTALRRRGTHPGRTSLKLKKFHKCLTLVLLLLVG